ncbi:MAG TPA: pantoate--beta-alanine ligase [Acidobacteriota bacterium]|nr:pantoate--beta-alanine ligase [Acidobacteriota bacterium]
MEIIQRVLQMKEVSKKLRSEARIIGLVPTMGYLHQGHLELVRQARKMSDIVVTSIFVNPTQFAPNEDFERYPRDLTRDAEILSNEAVDFIFAPREDEMYPSDFRTTVKVRELSERLEGASRPTHFEGVTTVVMKLFHIVDPHFAFFGQKDAQQFYIVQRMVRDMNMDVEMIRIPTVREADGLAMSSRNAYLTPDERKAAPVLFRALEHARTLIEKGERKSKTILKEMRDIIEKEPLAKIDYIAVTDNVDLKDVKTIKGKTLISVAATFGNTRLIDNLIIEPEK